MTGIAQAHTANSRHKAALASNVTEPQPLHPAKHTVLHGQPPQLPPDFTSLTPGHTLPVEVAMAPSPPRTPSPLFSVSPPLPMETPDEYEVHTTYHMPRPTRTGTGREQAEPLHPRSSHRNPVSCRHPAHGVDGPTLHDPPHHCFPSQRLLRSHPTHLFPSLNVRNPTSGLGPTPGRRIPYWECPQ